MKRLTTVLLVVQAANLALASLLQLFAFGSAVGLVGSVGLLLVRRWPRVVVLVEVVMLLGTLPRLLEALIAQQLPDGGWLLGSIALPLAVLASFRVTSERAVLVGLLLASAAVHLALVPEHGLAFLVDAALLVAVLRWRRWTGWVLTTNLLVYAVAILAAKESVDALALGTKLLEVVALGLAVPSGTWLAAIAALLMGGITWAGVARDHGLIAHVHGLTNAPPSYEQRVAAHELVAATRAAIAQYTDVSAAEQAGYHLSGPPLKTMHYVNAEREHDSDVLDPERPEGLVYVQTDHGPWLVGALFIMPRLGLDGPQPGGSITHWHSHDVCIELPRFQLTGLATPLGACPPGSINLTTPEMMHVWTVDNPGGPFADDLDPAVIARLSKGSSAGPRAGLPAERSGLPPQAAPPRTTQPL